MSVREPLAFAQVARQTRVLPHSVLISELTGGFERFARLTYPRFAPWLVESGAQIVAIGALAEGRPIGLALARVETANTARLLSLNVEASWRERGIGAALLAASESALAERGALDIMAMHSSRTVSRGAFERTLAAADWEASRLAALRVTGRCGPMLEAVGAWPSMRRLLAQSTYTFAPWAGIDANDREAIEHLCAQPPCRSCAALTPAMWPDAIEPVTSFVVRRDRRLVGWVISEHQPAREGSPGSIHYAAAYLDTALWHTGVMVAAYRLALERQAAVFGPTSLARFETPVFLRGMFGLIRRRLAPLALSADEVLVTRKLLQASAPDVVQ
jgi:GNAT superfamily N-acetyltransferase